MYPAMIQESALYSRTYDLLVWLLPRAARFPRLRRSELAWRVASRALDLQESLMFADAQRDEEQRIHLARADAQLSQLVKLVRICKEQDMLSTRQYTHVSAMLVEIGCLLDGWQNS